MTENGGEGSGKPAKPRGFRRTLLRALAVVLVVSLVAAGGYALWLRSQIMASLPILEGEVVVEGLYDLVTVERDAAGVPTIRAANRIDAARALGFLHGQERFFQMDLLRRSAAGELAELLGPAVVNADRRMRVHRFRPVAWEAVESLSHIEYVILESYAEGVNTGLAALGAKPPEYFAMSAEPDAWLIEDCLLVVYAMYDSLQGDGGRRESFTGLAKDLLPGPLFEFLAARGDEWDAPIVGEAFEVAEIPGPEVIDLRAKASPDVKEAADLDDSSQPSDEAYDSVVGSNNWAVAGAHTADGRALLANDMHLGLGLPNIWYRAALELAEVEDGAPKKIVGVTLPGMPAIVAGTNGMVAWGFTNSQGDWKDLVIVEVDPDDPDRYRTPDGWTSIVSHSELIRVKGGDDIVLEVRETIWGPIIGDDHLGRPRAMRWIAHDAAIGGFGFLALESARDVEEAIVAANRAEIPTQNFTVADHTGRIGWSLMGPMPDRFGHDGRVPVSWADGSRGWDGHLDPADYPRVLDPESGRIWTANNRVVDGEMLGRIGDGGFAGGARAGQIRDGLMALASATPADMLAIQLDDRALFLERWRELLLDTLTGEAVAGDTRRAEFARLVREDWSGRASVESSGYRLVRGWRTFLATRVFEPLVGPCLEADEDFDVRWIGRWEGPLWKLVTERPMHLLGAEYSDWDALLLSGVDEALDYFLESDDAVLAEMTWGARNSVRVQHPISLAVPMLGRWLDAPVTELPGDSSMPRVQSPRFGASQRMVVPVGNEGKGLFHMPGGQGGHPFSDYYVAGHGDWVEGVASPLLPRGGDWVLTLLP